MKKKDYIITSTVLFLFVLSFISIFIIDYSWGKNRGVGEVLLMISPVLYLFLFPFIFPPMQNKSKNNPLV